MIELHTVINTFSTELNSYTSNYLYAPDNASLLINITLFLAIISCFFGFKCYKYFSGIAAFFVTAFITILLLHSFVDRGAIVTTFSILGIVAAFVIYSNPKLSAMLLCFVIGYIITFYYSGNILVSLIFSTIIALGTYLYAYDIIILTTTYLGAITITNLIPNFITFVFEDSLNYLIIIFLVIFGLIVQYMTNPSIPSKILKGR